MKLQVIVVRDSKADCFGQPQFVPSVGAAVRGFGDEVNNEKSVMFRHPGDFALYHIGEYDDSNARIDLFGDHRQIARAVDFVQGREVKQ